MTAADGYTYNRASIEAHMEGRRGSPVTGGVSAIAKNRVNGPACSARRNLCQEQQCYIYAAVLTFGSGLWQCLLTQRTGLLVCTGEPMSTNKLFPNLLVKSVLARLAAAQDAPPDNHNP